MKKDELLEQLNQEHANKFNGSLHDLLWEILIEEKYSRDVVCFVSAYTSTGLVLGIAHEDESGYEPTRLTFVDTQHDRAIDLLVQLNLKVFGLDRREASLIVLSSMRTKQN